MQPNISLQRWHPVWDGYFADPYILKTQGGYYAFGTDGPEAKAFVDTGLKFPVLHSKDLQRWDYLGGAVRPRPGLSDLDYWAPAVAERNGTFYLYYSCGGKEGEGQQLRVAAASRPDGPYEPYGDLLMPDIAFSIDAQPFCDPADGQWYLFFSQDYFSRPVGTGIAAVKLGNDMVSVIGTPTTVLRARAPWQIYERNRYWYGKSWKRWHTCEGAAVISRSGKYYLFYSGGNWHHENYGVSVAVSNTPIGRYRESSVRKGPKILQSQTDVLRGPGHNSVAESYDGKSHLIAFHSWNKDLTKRQMYLGTLDWTVKGRRVEPTLKCLTADVPKEEVVAMA